VRLASAVLTRQSAVRKAQSSCETKLADATHQSFGVIRFQSQIRFPSPQQQQQQQQQQPQQSIGQTKSTDESYRAPKNFSFMLLLMMMGMET